VFGGISIKANKLIVAVLGLSLLFIGCVSATDHSMNYGNANYDGMSGHGHHDDQNLNHADRGWNHNGYDWLSGGYYPYYSTYYYNGYYTPQYTYTYYPTYYYTEPVYYNTPVVYHDWDMYPWGPNFYGFGKTYYSSSSHWTYGGGYGFGDL
jgi:hypothetical protein